MLLQNPTNSVLIAILLEVPSEEAFQKTAARGKKAKAAKEEASGAAGDGSRSKRARK